MKAGWRLLLAACAPLEACAPARHPPVPLESHTAAPHLPDYAQRPFEPFTRANAVAIALREWRAFGQAVNDDPPDARELAAASRPDHQPGLWQRVGDYWWVGLDPGAPQADWTGKYDGAGTPYADEDESHAWSAAFVSYVMRVAGAGDRFVYAINHAAYINAARQGVAGLTAERPDTHAPAPGDLICTGRGRAQSIRFDDLPAPRFPAHCDLVIAAAAGMLSVVGGNVDGGVTMKHVPMTQQGTLAAPGGAAIDPRYAWFVVLWPHYDD